MSGLRKIIIIIVIAILAGGFLGSILASEEIKSGARERLSEFFGTEERTGEEERIPEYLSIIDYEETIIGVIEEVADSVVSIVVTKDLPVIRRRSPEDPFSMIPPEFREFFFGVPFDDYGFENDETIRREIGGGTGFIISPDGMIVTNRHVVEDEVADYTVLLNDGRSFDAEVIARSPVQDLAVLKINADEELQTVSLGNSDSLRLGQTIIAIGNALGEFRNTVSVGVVSGLSRNIVAAGGGGRMERFEGLVQTDAAINRGNSGGPLVNLRGEIVGINVAMAIDAQNIGFAIPINHVRNAIESIKETGEIRIPFLGIRYYMINREIAQEEELPVEYGALVRGGPDGPGVFPDTPAYEAGVQENDIIIRINNQRVDDQKPLWVHIREKVVGETITLTVIREGEELSIEVTLAVMPEDL